MCTLCVHVFVPVYIMHARMCEGVGVGGSQYLSTRMSVHACLCGSIDMESIVVTGCMCVCLCVYEGVGERYGSQ